MLVVRSHRDIGALVAIIIVVVLVNVRVHVLEWPFWLGFGNFAVVSVVIFLSSTNTSRQCTAVYCLLLMYCSHCASWLYDT